MSRTTLCVVTAAGLAALSICLMVCRHAVLGDEVKVPLGPGTWKVTMVVRGKSRGTTRLITAAPLDFTRQHIFNESFRSHEFKEKSPDLRTQDTRHPERRLVLWTQRPGGRKKSFQARYEFCCAVNFRPATASMGKLTRRLYAPPRPGEYVGAEPRIDPSDRSLNELALKRITGKQKPADQARELFRFVDKEIGNDPTVNGPGISAVDCLESGSGDAAAKGRLLVALCRNRGIPARLVMGLALVRAKESAHVWVEAWVNNHWMSMCPVYHYLDKVPSTYLIFGYGDLVMARGHNVSDLDYAFRVEHLLPREAEGTQEETGFSPRKIMLNASFYALPPTERRLVEFLLLLPIAALIICLYRNVIGLNSFGTFAPALIGLAFRDLKESWRGIVVFVAIVLIGWGMRRILDRYHLLQVPRKAFVLSLVVLLLLLSIMTANSNGLDAARYVTLFPMVILTGMIERFWTIETEDGAATSFKTLLSTLVIAGTISLILSFEALVAHMFHYPETLGLIMALQLLIGRYTGYRLSELYRFRDFVETRPHGV